MACRLHTGRSGVCLSTRCPAEAGTAAFGPLVQLFVQAYAGVPLAYYFNPGVCWFVLWLLNFSIAYAVIAQFTPKLKVGMPHPFVLLVAAMPLCGVFYAINNAIGPWINLGGMNMWTYGASMYIPFFTAGVLGGRNDWLKSVEEMKTWVVWTLRVIVVGFWILMFLYINAHALPIPGVHMKFSVMDFISPVYDVAMTLAIMQLFHQYFNATPQSQFMRNAGASAYIVYVIQLWPLMTSMIIFVEILKAAGVQIVWQFYYLLFTVDPDGKPAPLSDGWIR